MGARLGLVGVLLTFAAGSTDLACFLRLGHVFASVMTGNLVLLGLAAGTDDRKRCRPACGIATMVATPGSPARDGSTGFPGTSSPPAADGSGGGCGAAG